MCYATNNKSSKSGKFTGKSETIFNLRLNNHRKDVNQQNSLQSHQHFRLLGQKFNKHAKLTLIKQLNDTNIDKELIKYRLEKRENFWGKKLKTLQPHGFNTELNLPNP